MAQTYKFGNGTWATKKGSTLAYSDTNNAFKPLPFSFERNSIATRVNKEGLIEVVGNDIPRIDYTDSTEGALLLENSATNLIPYSEDFTQWATFDCVVSSTSNTQPNGKSSGYIATYSSNSSVVRYFSTVASGTSYIFTAWVKSNQNGTIKMARSNQPNDGAYINVTTEWKRFEVQITPTSSSDGGGFYRLSDSDLNSIEIWGAQLEESYATSYIPTNGSIIQRAAETCNESGNSEVFNDSQGVLFANVSALSTTGRIALGTTSNNVRFNYDASVNRLDGIVFNGSNQAVFNYILPTQNCFNKILIKYKPSDFSFFVNGFKVGSLVGSGTTFTEGTLSQLNFDAGNGALPFYGNTKQIAYYDTTLTDEELEYMTSYRSLNEMVTELNLNAL